MALEIGQKVPDFTVPSADGTNPPTPFTLSKELGKGPIVLAFFPFAFTSVCTTQLCHFRDNLTQYDQLNAKVFGVSVDSPATLQKFAQEQKFNFKLLSDFNKELIQQFGAMHEALGSLKGVAKRSVFVLDKNGTVRYKWVSEDPKQLPDFNAVKKAVEGAR
jgi:peroxiredoxin